MFRLLTLTLKVDLIADLLTSQLRFDPVIFVLAVVQCPTPPIVGNSTRLGHTTTYGAVIVYTCPNGYYINNTGPSSYLNSSADSSATIHCRADGSWSHEPEACLSMCLLRI